MNSIFLLIDAFNIISLALAIPVAAFAGSMSTERKYDSSLEARGNLLIHIAR